MPIAEVQLPNGKIAQFDVPEGTTPDQVVDFATKNLASFESPKEKISPLDAFNMRAANSLTAGFLPAINAGAAVAAREVKSLFGKKDNRTYDDYLREEKQLLEDASNQNPVAGGAGDVAGIIGGLFAAAPTKAATGVKAVSTIPSLWKQMKTGAKIGGGVLGAQQAVTTEGDLEDKLKAGAKGVIGGSIVGSAAPIAIEGGSKLLTGGSSALKGLKNVYSSATGNTKAIQSEAENLAGQQIKKAIDRSNTDLVELPPSKNVLQSNSPGVVDRAETIAQRSNQASDRLRKYAGDRAQELPNDLSVSLGKTFKEQDYPTVLEGLKEKAYADAKPAYEQAYKAVESINDNEINKLLDKVAKAGDWKVLTSEAQKLAAYDGHSLGNIDATGVLRSYSTKDLDYMTRALRNLGQATEGQGAMGSRTPIGAIRQKTSNEIRNRIKDINPAFKEATGRFGDDVTVYNAAESGKSSNLFGNNYKAALSEYNKLPNETAKAAWRLGQAENLHSLINNNPSSALKRFNSPQFRKAMESFYTPEEFNSLVTSLNNRLREQNVLSRITGNSRTQARLAMEGEDKAMQGGLGALASDVITSGPRRALLSRAADSVENFVTNTPIQKEADKLVVDFLLSTPFQLAGKTTTGQLPVGLLQSSLNKNIGAINPNIRYNANPIQTGLLSGFPLISGD